MDKLSCGARGGLAGLWGLSLFLAACVGAAAPSPTPTLQPTSTPAATRTPEPTPVVSVSPPLVGLSELMDALRAEGATVETAEAVEQPAFSVEGQVVRVNGAEVQVFEYADQAAREAESARITPEGQPSPTVMVMWVDQPNFWAAGRVIVLYVGREAEVIARLTRTLGEPITTATRAAQAHPEAVVAAINALAELKGIPKNQISVSSVEPVMWNDSCLGVDTPGLACLQVITPGYRVVLSAGGERFTFHTNESGSALRLAP